MTTLLIEALARCAGLAIGYFLIGAMLAYRDRRRERAAAQATGSHPYRSPPFQSAGQEPTTDPREAWDAGVAAERARVLTLVRAASAACSEESGRRVAGAIEKGVEVSK